MLTPPAALTSLIEGNLRFIQDKPRTASAASRRRQNVDGQKPFAIILGCADSRVPVEMIFDQSLGDLFVVRVAGNIVTPSQLGSIEFAASEFGTRLVVVLGHTQCGAVKATLEHLQNGENDMGSAGLNSIVNHIQPAISPLVNHTPQKNLLANAVRANIQASVNKIRHQSNIIKTLGAQENLLVVGAEYALDTGQVDFFDGMPERDGPLIS